METTEQFLAKLGNLKIKLWKEGDRLRYKAPKATLSSELLAEIKARKTEILDLLEQAEIKNNGDKKPLLPEAREGHIPASFAQQRLWFLEEMTPNTAIYNISYAARLMGDYLNVEVLKQAFQELCQRHESLRTNFTVVDGQPVQVVRSLSQFDLPVIHWQAMPDQQKETEVQKLIVQEAEKPFDLEKELLLRVKLLCLSPEEYLLVLNMHHIISDGWSFSVIFRELSALYEAFSQGKPSPLPPLVIQYPDFALWQRRWFKGEVMQKQLNYWKQQLGGETPVLELPIDHRRPIIQSFKGAIQSFELPERLTQGLKALSNQEGTTLFMTLLAAFQTLLYRYTSQEKCRVGSPIANRNRAEIEGLIGFFVNTLVLETNLSGNPTFRELLKKVRQVTLEAYENQDLPFEKLVEELNPERDSLVHSPLFRVMFALQNEPRSDLKLGNLKLIPIKTHNQTTKFDLSVFLWEKEDKIRGTFEYNSDRFDATTINCLGIHFRQLLEGIVHNPNQEISGLPLLTETEHHQLLVEWNQTETDYPRHKSIHQIFEEQVSKTPDAVAVIFEKEQLTYCELNEKANQLAYYLQSLGVKPEVLVSIYINPSLEMIIAILGILKAGGAYLPLDTSAPSHRLQIILEDANSPILITQQSCLRDLDGIADGIETICVDDEINLKSSSDDIALKNGVTADNLAYVMYTSGSTGNPKGVCVLHRGVVRLVKNTNYAHFGSDEVVLQLASIAFDAATFEIWAPLLNGGKLVVMPSQKPSLQEIGTAIKQNNVTTVWLTAGLFNLMVEEQIDYLKPLRQLLAGGDVLSVPHVKKLLEELPHIQLINGYGPTENTTFTCCHKITVDDITKQSIPIGRPIANSKVYVLDNALQLVPVGISGELYIGGDGLASCYLNQPHLSQESFIPNPFSNETTSYLYKTGDRVRWNKEGNLEFLGRIDFQVKIRGYRIELGEIEAVLRQHLHIREVVVGTKEIIEGDKPLVAYLVANFQDTELMSQAQLQDEQVEQWQTLYNRTYSEPATTGEPTFNIVGWNSTYTDQPIPAEQMEEWVKDKVGRILDLKPSRVLEIGCGTGLLLFRIAPHCQEYWGTDFSQVCLDSIQTQLKTLGLSQVKLFNRMADNFTDVEAGSFDAIILNSIVQYFPSQEYLLSVIEGAIEAVAPGGFIFFGDLRSLPLLPAFHTAVELAKAVPACRGLELRQKIQRGIFQETELAVDSAFFSALKERFPQISNVEVYLTRGQADNELTQFRYNAIVHIGSKTVGYRENQLRLDWNKEQLTLSQVEQFLKDRQPEILVITTVPNARVAKVVKTWEWLSSTVTSKTVRQLEADLQSIDCGVEPQQWWDLGERLPYTIDLSWANSASDGSYDVVCVRQHDQEKQLVGILKFLTHKTASLRPWYSYTNYPLKLQLTQHLLPQLQDYLKQKLPEYMIPAHFVFMDSLPLNPNGKVNRRDLPVPEIFTPSSLSRSIEPRDDLEHQLREIWEQVLGVQPIGVEDDFFDLGGHSLLAVRLLSHINKSMEKTMTLASLFQAPTIEKMANVLRQEQPLMVESSLISLQPHGHKSPLFLVPPAGQTAMPFSKLADYFGPDQPVYGLQHLGMDGEQKPLTTVEEMATHFVKDIKHLQPEGPYYLAGKCSGGAIAYEIAQQLMAEGKEVPLLVMLDVLSPPRLQKRTLRYYLIEIFVLVWKILRDGELIEFFWIRLQMLLSLLKYNNNLQDKLSKSPKFVTQVYYTQTKARSKYITKPYPGKIFIVLATSKSKFFKARQIQKWHDVVVGELEYEILPVDHVTMLDEPEVKIVAEVLKRKLAQNS